MFQGQWSFLGLDWVHWPRGHPVGDGVVLNVHPTFGPPTQRASSWLSSAENHLSAERSLQHLDGGDAIGCATLAKLTRLVISGINTDASARAVGCRAQLIQWAGTLD